MVKPVTGNKLKPIMDYDLYVIERILSDGRRFLESTLPARMQEKPLWLGTVARLFACFGYSQYDSKIDSKNIVPLWNACFFTFQSLKDRRIDKNLTILKSDELLQSYWDTFSEGERRILESLPTHGETLIVEHGNAIFEVNKKMVSILNGSVLSPAHEINLIELMASDNFPMNVPGEFFDLDTGREVKESDYQECVIEKSKLKIHKSLPPLLNEKTLTPITVYMYGPYGRSPKTLFTKI